MLMGPHGSRKGIFVSTDLAVPGVAYAYANYGRWVTDCPRQWCTNALQVRRGQTHFECDGPDSCGWTAPLVWPPDPDAIEAILAARPANSVRNWALGEPLAKLIEENAAHDCLPAVWTDPGLERAGAIPILSAVDEVAVGGIILPAVEARKTLHAIQH
jgi:hypothetical protein